MKLVRCVKVAVVMSFAAAITSVGLLCCTTRHDQIRELHGRLVWSIDKAGQRYDVDTPVCKIPHLNPWHPSINHLVKKTHPLNCNGSHPPYKIEFNRITIQLPNVFCEYRAILRSYLSSSDNAYSLADAVKFEKSIQIDVDAVYITCYNETGRIHNGIHPIVRPTPKLDRELLGRRVKFVKKHDSKERFNVIAFGIDGTSRLNMIRQMPLTRGFLSRYENVFELKGYNKVADNTFVNLIPLLTGKYVDEFWNETIRFTPLDNAPFLWRNYSTAGYKTFLAQDNPTISAFNYQKRGFKEQPTDVYLRPWTMAVTQSTLKKESIPFCLGSQQQDEFYLNFVEEFLRLHQNTSVFGVAFLSELTHFNVNQLGAVDHLYERFFRTLFERHMHNTVFVLFSDHGARFGLLRQSIIGKLEERLPFAYVMLPPRFLKKYPDLVQNLRTNEARLTTPFDVHATLQHLLYFDGVATRPSKNSRGISLFHEISEQRTCEDATILPHWCTCYEQQPVPRGDPLVLKAAATVIRTINQLITNAGLVDRCASLWLGTVLSVMHIKPNENVLTYQKSMNDVINRTVFLDKQKRTKAIDDFILSIEMRPGDARFEATVRFEEATGSLQVLGPISRVNLYGDSASCIDVSSMKLFCFCKNNKKGSTP